jgi:chromosome segregation ATPase
MEKGIRSTAEHGSVGPSILIRCIFASGFILVGAAFAAVGQEPPAAPKPTEPKPQQAATASATPPGAEALKAQEQAQRELQWRQEMKENAQALRQEVKESIATLRQELREMRQQREREAARWQEIEKSLSTITERVQGMAERMRAAREESGKQQSQSEEIRRQQELLQAKVRDVEKQLGAVKEQTNTDAKIHGQQLDGVRKDLQRMGRTVGELEQGRLKAEADLKADVQNLRGELGQVRGTLHRLLTESDRSTVGSAGYTWGW